MMYQKTKTKDDLKNRLRNIQLMQQYEDSKNGDNGFITIPQMANIGKNLYNGAKNIYNGMKGVATGNYPNFGYMAQANQITPQVNTPSIQQPSVKSSMPSMQQPQIQAPTPSISTPSTIPTTAPTNTIGNGVISNAINTEVMGNGANAGTSAIGNAIGQEVGNAATQGASSIAQTAGKALPIAGSALSVGMDAKDMVNNGVNLRNGSDMLADIGSGVALATGVGAPVALAIQAGKFIKNLIMGAIEKKKQKAMARSQKAANEEQAKSEASIDEGKQKMEQQRQQNLQNMQQSQQALANTSEQAQSPVAEAIQQQMQPQDIKNDLFNRVIEQQIPQPQQEEQQGGNDMLNALGTVANVLPTGNTQTPNPQTPTPQTPTPTPQTPNPQPQVPQKEQSVTGGAAPVAQPTNYKTENQPLSYEGSAQQEIDKNAVMKQSLMDKIRNGFNDFSEGYQDNANSSLSTGDLAKRFQQPTQPQKTEDGAYIASADQNKKSIMARLGELAGTGQRIASHPLTHAAIAAGISKAAGGDIDDMAKAAWQYGTQKAEADRYYQDVTGKTNRPFFNTYDINDYKTKVQQDQWNKNYQQKQNEFDWKQEKDERDYNYKMNKDTLDRQNRLQTAQIRANGRGGRGSANGVAQQKYDYQQELKQNMGAMKQYYDAVNNAQDVVDKKGWFANSQQKAQLENAKKVLEQKEAAMIKRYGTDYLEMKKKIYGK